MDFLKSPGGWQISGFGLLTAVLLVAVITDWNSRRIPNALVGFALGAGVLLHAVGPTVWMRSGGLFTLAPAALGMSGALLGAVLALGLFLPLYAGRIVGAGDVKLLAGVGSFSGPSAFLNIAVCVLLCGGLLALARMVFAANSKLVLRNVSALLVQSLPGQVPTFNARLHTAWRMPYSIAVMLGVAAYAAWTLTDHAALIDF